MSRQVILHALGAADGSLMLWAEDSNRIGVAHRRGFNPMALGGPGLQKLLKPALGSVTTHMLDLALPAEKLDGPAQLSPFLTSTPALPKPTTVEFGRFEVATAPYLGSDLLEELPLLVGDAAPWRPADSLRYWHLVVQLTLQVLQSGRFHPRLAVEAGHSEHQPSVSWEAAWHDSELLAALAALTETAPMAALSFDGGCDNAFDVTRNFIDATITRVAQAHAPSIPEDAMSAPFLEMAAGDQRPYYAGRFDAAMAAGAVSDIGGWAAELDAAPTAASARTVLRLRLQPPQMSPDMVLPPVGTVWEVSFVLQSKKDPSLRLDVGDLWRNPATVADFAQVVGANPEREFAGLAEELGAVWPAALMHRGGTVRLDDDELANFLCGDAGTIDVAGFPVDLPAGWGRVQRLKATIEGAGPGPGIFTMQALFDFDITVAAQNLSMSVETLSEMAARRIPLALSHGQWMRFDPKHVARMLAALEKFKNATVGDALMASAELADLDEDLDITFHGGLWLDSFLGTDHTSLARLPLGSLPAHFRKELKHWQESGIAWMHRLEQLGINGCLADDMGLGKSRQLLGLLLAERQDPDTNPTATLLVAPSSVLKDWRKEVAKSAPELKLYVHHGAGALSGGELRDAVASADLVLTTYDKHKDSPERLGQFRWWRLALDESHLAKNPTSKRARTLRDIDAQRRVALTGTPMLNRLDELWALMSFLNPGLLGSRQGFRQRFVTPINGGDTVMQEKLRQLVRPFFLRRSKTDPDIAPHFKAKRVPHHLEWKMTAEQAALYQSCIADSAELIRDEVGALSRRNSVMKLINQLRGICNHPGQYLGWDGEFAGRSGKVSAAVDIIEAARAKGEKTLLFVFYAKKLAPHLAAHLEEVLGCEVPIFAGGMSEAAKSRLRDRFADDPNLPVLIVSQGAGANGMNMTAANHVIHFDRSWSPGIEDQCSDRALRLDQEENVHVYTLTCMQAPIEVLIAQTHLVKSELNVATFGGKEALAAMDDDELFEALTMSQDLARPLAAAA